MVGEIVGMMADVCSKFQAVKQSSQGFRCHILPVSIEVNSMFTIQGLDILERWIVKKAYLNRSFSVRDIFVAWLFQGTMQLSASLDHEKIKPLAAFS